MQMLWYDDGLSLSFNTALFVSNQSAVIRDHMTTGISVQGHHYLDPRELPVAETIYPIHTTTPDQREYKGNHNPDDPFNTRERVERGVACIRITSKRERRNF